MEKGNLPRDPEKILQSLSPKGVSSQWLGRWARALYDEDWPETKLKCTSKYKCSALLSGGVRHAPPHHVAYGLWCAVRR
eukprot:4682136-Prymnesium_polylepis.1